MTRFAAFLFLLVLLPTCTEAAFAQRDPDPALLMRRWAASQAEDARNIQRIIIEERTERVLDGPFGLRTMRVHARLTGSPRSSDWRRDILEAFANDRELTDREYRRFRSNHHLGSRQPEWLLEDFLLPSHLLAGMKPVGSATRVRWGEDVALQFDVATLNARAPVHRVTIWMDPDHARLLRTRAVWRRPEGGATTLVTTSYSRIGGFDVPVRRSIEGTTRTRRRLRIFTLVFRVETEYLDHRIDRP